MFIMKKVRLDFEELAINYEQRAIISVKLLLNPVKKNTIFFYHFPNWDAYFSLSIAGFFMYVSNFPTFNASINI